MSTLILTETEHEAILTSLIPLAARLVKIRDPRRRERQILEIYRQYDRHRAFKDVGELLDRALLRKDHLPSAGPARGKATPARKAGKPRRRPGKPRQPTLPAL